MARVIVDNPQLPKPFKRYIIVPVWRYEEVTAGRKRQFYQCDIDIVGVSGMEAESECLACAVDCLQALGFNDFTIIINNRKILEGFISLTNIPKEKSLDVFRIFDKLKKFGKDFIEKELKELKVKKEQIQKLFELISLQGDASEVLEKGKEMLRGIKIAEDGVKELEEIYEQSKIYGFSDSIQIDFSLARGIDYYTGPIFEITTKTKTQVGSIAGGGRYDNLIELLGGKPTPATGISLGVERIIEIMKNEKMLNLPKTKVKVFVGNVDKTVKNDVIKISKKLRKENIPCQIDLMNRNLTKQLEFADKLGIPYFIIVGSVELKKGNVKVRDMQKREVFEIEVEKLIDFFKKI
jgi:histidyl-tRNA synthetase